MPTPRARRALRRILPFSAFLFVALAACARLHSDASRAVVMQQGAPLAMHGRVTDHVIVISIDGLRADAIHKYHAPTIERLMREGRYSLTAQTINTSLTLPSHTSMLTGVPETVHGVTWNSDKTKEKGYVAVPTIFGLAHSAGFVTAAFFSKTKFHHLEVPFTLDYAVSPHGSALNSMFSEQRTTGYLGQYLEHANPNLVFVHLMEPDFIGHQFGWMGRMYGLAVREADLGVAQVIKEADAKFGRGRYTVILTADHGGHGSTHGTTDPRDLTIPWIVWGDGVQRGDTLSGIRTMDTAATVLWLLGVVAPQNWVGRPVTRAFESTFVSGR
jgi:predicted AlkP superfamily pyrophosphatase or phosphodiesterase